MARVQVRGPPGRVLGLHLGQRRLEHLGLVDPPGQPLALLQCEHVAGDLAESPADLGAQLPIPSLQPLLDGLTVVGLGFAGRQRRLLLHVGQFQGVRFAAHLGLERAHQRGGLLRDRLAAGAEQVHHSLVDPDDLPGFAVGAHLELHAERLDQVLFHHPLTDGAGGRLPAVQRLGVDGAPLAIGSLHAIQNGVVDMQLRVMIA
nr:hypothetical protein [Kribbella antiqua]